MLRLRLSKPTVCCCREKQTLKAWRDEYHHLGQSAPGINKQTKKPLTSEVVLRDPGSSHLDWLHRSFATRNRVTSRKPLLIFKDRRLRDNIWSQPPSWGLTSFFINEENNSCARHPVILVRKSARCEVWKVIIIWFENLLSIIKSTVIIIIIIILSVLQ